MWGSNAPKGAAPLGAAWSTRPYGKALDPPPTRPSPLPPAPGTQAACSSATACGYDLVAVQPGNERLFQMACSTLECDLVSLDLCRRLPYRFKPAAVKAALARGLHFEVCALCSRQR